jgi:hypothetical protein
VRGLGNFVFMKNRLVPVKSWKPVFKRRNNATLKKGHSIQVNINPTLQKCEHCPGVVKKTQIVFPPARADKPRVLPGPPLWQLSPPSTTSHHQMPDLTMRAADPCPTNNAKRAKHSKILKPGCFFVFTPFYQLVYSVLCVSRMSCCPCCPASSFPPLASCRQLSDSCCSAARRGSTSQGLHGHQMMPSKDLSFGWNFSKIVSVSKFLAGRMQWGRPAAGMEAVGPPSDSKYDSVKG